MFIFILKFYYNIEHSLKKDGKPAFKLNTFQDLKFLYKYYREVKNSCIITGNGSEKHGRHFCIVKL